MKRQMPMGIDVGTQSTRVALLDLEGQVVASTSTPQEMMTPRPGWAEQDPDVWWRNALDNIHKTMEQAEATPDEILAVGVCGQMHAAVPLSKDGELRASDITGTASIMSIYVEEPVLDPRLMNLHHALPGWIPFGISDSGGGALKWFKDELCQTEAAEAERQGRI